MKKTLHFALVGAALGLLSNGALAQTDCMKLSEAVKQAVSAEQSAILKIVQSEVTANPGCACEVVKAAIEASNASREVVASIVETAVMAAPEHMALIAQCAIAMAPDALADVQAVLAKLDPNRGEEGYSAKAGPQGLVQPPSDLGNPLDFPGQSEGQPPVVVGVSPGGPGGFPMLPPGFPLFVPPVVMPPQATQ